MAIELYNKKNPFLYPTWYVSKIKKYNEKLHIMRIGEYGEVLEEQIIMFISKMNNHDKMLTRIGFDVNSKKMYFFYCEANRITTQVITRKLDIILYPWREQFEIPIRKDGKLVQKIWLIEKLNYCT